MVEVHLMARETATTVEAGNLTKLAQEGRGLGLATRHALDLALPVRGVVRDVRPTLVSTLGHDSV